MVTGNVCSPPSEDDLRAALKEMRSYVDITEEDLKKIYELALQHARDRITSRILVKEAMTKNTVTVRRDADLQTAATLLSENRVSGMPVVDNNNRVIGVISEADILILTGMKRDHTFKDILRNILGGPVSAKTTNRNKVEDVMSFPPVTSKADDTIADVAKILDERRIKRLPVVDDNGTLLGIISRADIVRMIGSKV